MSEMVKALGMALGSNSPDKWGGKPPTATCPNEACGEPLISTMVFPGKEFACLGCGRTCGFVDPVPVEETPEVAARLAELQAEWDAARERGDDLAELLASKRSS